jgi:2-polyprenyl-3-methyl-5-hydroxy-6-metoxy-1,4-benzoquinol methylase
MIRSRALPKRDQLMNRSSTDINETLYDEFWRSCPDFSRYNPGVLHRRRAILKRLQQVHFSSLLDVGCGDGELIAWLGNILPPGIEYTGADLSSETVARNRERLPHAKFEVLNIEKQQLDQTFGAIVCTEVIEHLDDQPTALGHLRAMLEPGGHLVLTCPSGKVHATERHFGHVAHPTPEALRRMCEEAGFEVVSLENWGFPLYIGIKYLMNLRSEWALQTFGTGRYSATARFISRAVYLANFFNLPTAANGCQQFLVARRPG